MIISFSFLIAVLDASLLSCKFTCIFYFEKVIPITSRFKEHWNDFQSLLFENDISNGFIKITDRQPTDDLLFTHRPTDHLPTESTTAYHERRLKQRQDSKYARREK